MIKAGLCSGLAEMDRDWSLVDVLDANEFLDAAQDAEAAWNKARARWEEQRKAHKGNAIQAPPSPEVEAEIAEVLSYAERLNQLDGDEAIAEVERFLAEVEAADPPADV